MLLFVTLKIIKKLMQVLLIFFQLDFLKLFFILETGILNPTYTLHLFSINQVLAMLRECH